MNQYIIKITFALAMLFGTTNMWAQQGDSTEVATPEQTQVEMPNEVLWSTANESYKQKEYSAAIDSYTQILDKGVSSSELYYNLANAYFKQNNLGKAILFYNKALKLNPTDEDAKYNLTQVAMPLTRDRIDEIPEFILITWQRQISGLLGSDAWATFSILALCAALGFILIYLLNTNILRRKIGFYSAIVAFIVCIITTTFSLEQRRWMVDDHSAIVMRSSMTVKSSPDKSSTDLFILHEGTKVSIKDRIDSWVEVMIADGKRGWVEKKKIRVI